MNEAKAHQRHEEARSVEASRMCDEFHAAPSVEYNNANQLSMVVGREQAAVEKWADMLHQSGVVLDAKYLSQHVLRILESRDVLKEQYMR